MDKFIKGFTDFVREQGVVGMAVGLAIGVQAGATVKTVVTGFIDPIVGYILGGNDLGSLAWNTGLERGGVELVLSWGAIASAIITLIATAVVIYFAVEKAGLAKLDKKKK